MKDRPAEDNPATVPAQAAQAPAQAKQAGEVRGRWPWVEPSVWTDRMLAALEHGVRGGQWFSLIDKVHPLANLESAFAEVKANRGAAGVGHQTIEMFQAHLGENLRRLSEELVAGTYRPRAIRRVHIPKPGKRNETRPLGIPTVRDRVVQAAVRHVLEPIFERDFAAHSYGFRPGRSCKDALRQVNALLHKGFTWVVDADLKSYFDTIPHKALMDQVREKIADGRMREMIQAFLKQDVLEEAALWTPKKGSPQGAVISPLLSNIYLDDLDHQMARAGLEMIRYADDFVILCRSEAEARAALDRVAAWTAQAGLTLHPAKTRIVDAAQPGGFDFVGYHFERGYRWPGDKSLVKFKDSIRGHTRRTNGHSPEGIIRDVNRVLRGWFEYFKHSWRTTFGRLDSWVRMRLRSILRKRQKKRGRGRGSDHKRWPNAYFEQAGVFLLVPAHARLCPSPTGRTTNRRAGCGKTARPVRREGGPG